MFFQHEDYFFSCIYKEKKYIVEKNYNVHQKIWNYMDWKKDNTTLEYLKQYFQNLWGHRTFEIIENNKKCFHFQSSITEIICN